MRMAIAIVALSCATATPASAQTIGAPVKAKMGKPYRFAHSGIVTPATLDGMQRVDVRQLGDDELDVFAVYQNQSDAITVYVYRSLIGSVPVWFDRAKESIELRREMFGTVAPVTPVAFTPPGQSTASGLVAGWTLGKAPYRGTALAMLPVGEWLVKIRYSSTSLDGPAVAARIPAVLATLGWPSIIAAATAAAPIAECPSALTLSASAKPVSDAKALQQSALAGGLVAMAAASKGETPPATWCRDPVPARIGAAYRRNAATDAYLLAISDSARGLLVAPDVIAQEVAQSEGRTLRQWSVSLYDPGSVAVYPPMDALPTPDALMATLKGPVLSKSTTWGKKRKINVNPAFFK